MKRRGLLGGILGAFGILPFLRTEKVKRLAPAVDDAGLPPWVPSKGLCDMKVVGSVTQGDILFADWKTGEVSKFRSPERSMVPIGIAMGHVVTGNESVIPVMVSGCLG